MIGCPKLIRFLFAFVILDVFAVGEWLGAKDLEDNAAGNKSASANSPATTSDPEERLLLLNNSKVLKGVIQQTSTGYLVATQGGRLVLPFEQVRLEADDLEDAYRQQRAAMPHQAAAHVELARWCLTHSLDDCARKELRDALECDPDSSTAKTMLQRINDRLLTTKEIPAVVERNGQFSLLGDVKPGVGAEALGGLPREAASEFVAKVQPLLVNRCATAGCHGPGSKNSFELQRAKVGKGSPKIYSERNLAAVLERLDRDRPLNSELLVKLRGETKSLGVRQPHGGLSQDQTRTLRRWIESISKRPDEVANKDDSAEDENEDSSTVETNSLKRSAQTQSGHSDLLRSDQPEVDDNLYRRVLRELRSETSSQFSRSTTDE